MKETLYAIPVNEAFEQDSECPLCQLRLKYEAEQLTGLLRSAYMEPDCRIRSNEMGFCARHLGQMYARSNRLGMALMLQTHLARVQEEIDKILDGAPAPRRILFPCRHPQGGSKDLRTLYDRCMLCEQIERTEARYIETIQHLFAHDPAFAEKISACKGFCLPHFTALWETSGDSRFRDCLAQVQKAALSRIEQDLDGFTQRFDYRNAHLPWGNSRDAVERTANKLRGACCGEAQTIYVEE